MRKPKPTALIGAHDVKRILAKALRAMRSTEQGGYASYVGGGEWLFFGVNMMFTAAELNTLFKFCDIEPDVIVPKGACANCKHARLEGGVRRERGWEAPCVSCLKPLMSKFEPIPEPRNLKGGQ